MRAYFFFIRLTDPTFRVEGDGKRNILLGWPKEKLIQSRLAEAFRVLNLDLQGRLHYAPGDSRVHIAEKMMRSIIK